MHDVPIKPQALADFDFARNRALDERYVRELASAAFVNRGENLLIAGDCCTGKTRIARAIDEQASSFGKSCVWMSAPPQVFAEQELVGFGWSNCSKFKCALLDCDLLVVDDAHRWINSATLIFVSLLRLRSALGKSTVLLTLNEEWANCLNLLVPSDRWGASFARSQAQEMSDETWQALLSAGKSLRISEFLGSLGIDINNAHLPRMEARPPSQKTDGAVWHILQCGMNTNRWRSCQWGT